MTNTSRYLVNHLLTFSLRDGEAVNVEEAKARLSFLAQSKKLWIQQMHLDVGAEAVLLRDVQSQDELERYALKSIYRCEAANMEALFPSLLVLVCQSAEEKTPEILFFSCEAVKAEDVCADVRRAVSNRSQRLSDALRLPSTGGGMEPYDVPRPPIAHAPNHPATNPPPYPGPRANATNALNAADGSPGDALLRAQREIDILNHCFEDVESFMARLQQTAEAATVLSQRKKSKKKSKKQKAEEDLLGAKAQPPPEQEFVDIFQKFKYCFSLLARLRPHISNPSSEELVHHIFKPLDMMVKTTGGPALGASVSGPALTSSAVSLLKETLSEPERQLWASLGPNWTLPRSQLTGPVAPYSPVFLSGWKPEALRADRQVWEDPVESQHKHEALQVKEEKPQPLGPRDAGVSAETDVGTHAAQPERLYSCSYSFIARNSSELSVQQGETLEVIESSKRWWKCRNRFDEVGFVPFNILEPAAHIDSPVSNKAPLAPAPPPVGRAAATPSPPVLPKGPAHAGKRPINLPAFSQHVPAAEDTDKVMMVNDELLKRLTNGKTNLNKPLVIHRSAETTVPLDYHSPPEEVAQWLQAKGFSDQTVSCLGVLTGAQLFSLNKKELQTVIPDEGARVYSQLTVQKSLLEDAKNATELETVMEKQKMKVDLKLESGTL
ncbi:epidermal growth factor receptor kinase substrate 8-like protein 1 isoform X2 [Betta splendens]|uniref:Epidermal growth factor receptor kinase substrate 8-like protein 1 isoform X2 n=1 Tax=Betta splendens TaxID=158456 RepID=A0A6P7L9H4_BETSP|nr:epidermal growth factor receptor kinase substrate 8-like protein 1 isoform X2 [Betta splendens]